MEAFLNDNASAVFALLGAIFGSVFTGLINYVTKTKEVKLRIIEKLLDKKLKAHETIINIVGMIRTMVLLGGYDENGELKRCPNIMYSRKNMDDFIQVFSEAQNESDRWLSASLKRELSLFLDYIVNLNDYSQNSSDKGMQEVGVILRNDFIGMAVRIENSAHEFFNKDLLKLNYKTDRDWHKYTPNQTIAELEKTDLQKNKAKISSIFKSQI